MTTTTSSDKHKNRLKITVNWDVTSCSLIERNQCFGGTYTLHLQGRYRERRKGTDSVSRTREESGQA
jgi:hypothetical protein